MDRASGPGSQPVPPGPSPPNAGELLVAQALLPVVNRLEMRGQPGDLDRFGQPNELAAFPDDQPDAIRRAVIRRVLAIPEYVAMFNAAVPGRGSPGALGFEHAARAIAAFETQPFRRTNTPFDRYLARNDAALSPAAKRGARIFFGEAQCASCHNGALLGGGDFANVGAPQVGPGVWAEAHHWTVVEGSCFRESVCTSLAFRAPPLRNVELTAPYTHSGAYPTLEAVVRHYSKVQKAVRSYDVTQLPTGVAERVPRRRGDDQCIARVARLPSAAAARVHA